MQPPHGSADNATKKMDASVNRPVKAACLACRASKTRCDGQRPCKPCGEKNRTCAYRPSRRGGSRTKARNVKETKQSLTTPPLGTSLLPQPMSEPQSQSSAGTGYALTSSTADGWMAPLIDDSSLREIQALLSPFGAQNANDSPDSLEELLRTNWQSSIQAPVMRVYTSDEQIVNAYYLFLHPFLPLLPPAAFSHPDQPTAFQPALEGPCQNSLQCLPYQPTSSLTLALSAIFALIPLYPNQDPSEPLSKWLRRSYAQLFADSALERAEKEIEESMADVSCSSDRQDQLLHPDLPPRLHPILALVVLGIYEYCQRGSASRMRMRSNQAVTTAMDYSLHRLGEGATEPQKRAWWAAVLIMYQSSIITISLPVIAVDDPRITTPYPTLHVQSEFPQSWSLLMRAEDAYVSVSALMDVTRSGNSLTQSLGDQITRLDSHLLSLASECGLTMDLAENNTAEERASRGLGLITYILLHTARIKLHRFRAFSDIPIFLDKHCDLSSIGTTNASGSDGYPQSPAGSESTFPFTQDGSLITCLKSSLAVSRAFRNLPHIASSLHYDGTSGIHPDMTGKEFGTLVFNTSRIPIAPPYFMCAGLQACYSMYMLTHRIRAALSSKRLSICYPLLSHPDPLTETEDAERVLDEIRRGARCIIAYMEIDTVFEGVAPAVRDLNAVHQALFSEASGGMIDS